MSIVNIDLLFTYHCISSLSSLCGTMLYKKEFLLIYNTNIIPEISHLCEISFPISKNSAWSQQCNTFFSRHKSTLPRVDTTGLPAEFVI